MAFLLLAFVLFSPAIIAGAMLGLAAGSCGRVLLGTLTGAIFGTVLCAFLGFVLIPSSAEGGPHGGAMGHHLANVGIATLAGGYISTALSAWISVKLVRRPLAKSANAIPPDAKSDSSIKKQRPHSGSPRS